MFRKYYQYRFFNLFKAVFFFLADVVVKHKIFAVESNYLSDRKNKKIIAFSLYGDEDRYINNIESCISSYKAFFPGWQIRIYMSRDITNKIFNRIKELGCEIIVMKQEGKDFRYMYWRFLPLDDIDADVVLIRDIDSIASERERKMVDEWLYSNKKLHIIRDHFLHNSKIMGGMWGICINKKPYGILKKMHKFTKKNRYGSDQRFLEIIYDDHITDMHVNDVMHRYPNENPVIIPNPHEHFHIGQINVKS